MRFAPIGASLTLRLPRKSVRSHFGFEPQGGVSRQRTRASRLLFDLIRNADMEAASSSADFYMQLAVYDLVGALFAPTDPRPISRSADKLFARICGVVKDGLPDPDFGPAEVASEVGISLRYVQKLFTERSTTCSEFIYSHRLDHAAHLLHSRALTGTGQPLTRSPTLAASANMRISRGDSASGLAIRRALTRLRALCALVPQKVRSRHATSNFGRPRYNRHGRGPVRAAGMEGKVSPVEISNCSGTV